MNWPDFKRLDGIISRTQKGESHWRRKTAKRALKTTHLGDAFYDKGGTFPLKDALNGGVP